MTAAADPADQAPPKRSKLPLIIGLVLAIAGGAGGFLAVQMGLIGGTADQEGHAEEAVEVAAMPPVAFVPLDPLIVSLSAQGQQQRFLRFTAQLEVMPDRVAEVESLKPRIVDVLNGYLRAVDLAEFQDPTVLVRLRGQMLRRIQVVVGEGRVRDLLIMEFVLD